MIEIFQGILFVTGGLLMVVAGIGILRQPDVFIRMHASTKVGTLSSGLILLGVALHFEEPVVIFKVVLIVLFLLLTAPIGAHMIGRAALRIGVDPWGIERKTVRLQDVVAHEAADKTNPAKAGAQTEPDANDPADGMGSGR
ncbi:monovalent cation/H(+) antiporter subunit G [Citreimonas salinaria]|uniref:Monovalent cation/proton antiporter, MnhG/PhaG subunit n=1 Tax=Citreimonas salinaria TaxID=321339 RepID=A0A1H3JVP3_9RHOB|nr:monovalent cation/H(+) antiporter subunit G [Citreimonas salinaria]SDY43941.1 monovalent cation/proton antiporter, MnhG/PhaG subunit [Citreimonas salinaria]